MILRDVRQRYIAFFERRGHRTVPSSSLIPENDPTTLFTGSGMQPLLPYLLGEPHPAGKRVVNAQRCFRAEDIDEVGDNRHTTFFEMLGNWSLGDYFKKEQLAWFFEFLTDRESGAGLDPERLYVTVFSGDDTKNLPRDTESINIWKALFSTKGIEARDVEVGSVVRGAETGMQGGRIFAYDARKNWWSRAGPPEKMPAGEPGGPDSEVFFDFDPSGAAHDESFGKLCHPNCDCGRFMEIGNSVFMQYRKNSSGGFDELPKKNVDFGGGLERIAAATSGNADVFDVDVLHALISVIESQSGKTYRSDSHTASFRIVADHVRAAAFMIGDGVAPGNTERNYFTRRLVRRAIRHLDIVSARGGSLSALIDALISAYGDVYPSLTANRSMIESEMNREESKFRETLTQGVKKLNQLVDQKRVVTGVSGYESELKSGQQINMISGMDAFDLYQTYGFPPDVIEEELARRMFTYDKKEFQKAFNEAKREHQEKSRRGAEKKFKGGLADHSDMSVRYHTATHLLHQALRDVLGEHVFQKGSNITPERLRFDFTHHAKMTGEEKRRVEDIVNEKIEAGLPVSSEIIPIDEAKRRGAIGLFEDQYGEKVKVYKIGERGETRREGLYSLEFCGGPHVANTRELAHGGVRFTIEKEEAISHGIRRIRAVLTDV